VCVCVRVCRLCSTRRGSRAPLATLFDVHLPTGIKDKARAGAGEKEKWSSSGKTYALQMFKRGLPLVMIKKIWGISDLFLMYTDDFKIRLQRNVAEGERQGWCFIQKWDLKWALKWAQVSFGHSLPLRKSLLASLRLKCIECIDLNAVSNYTQYQVFGQIRDHPRLSPSARGRRQPKDCHKT